MATMKKDSRAAMKKAWYAQNKDREAAKTRFKHHANKAATNALMLKASSAATQTFNHLMKSILKDYETLFTFD